MTERVPFDAHGMRYSVLDTGSVDDSVRRLRRRFRMEGAGSGPPMSGLHTDADISDSDPQEVRELLGSLGIPCDEQVSVFWLSPYNGITTTFEEFVRFYDDLWFPSRDDVWVTNRDLSWLLELSHEEVVTFRTAAGAMMAG